MTHPLPTVEELVQVFIDNNWKGLRCSPCTTDEFIKQGLCCAVPALIKHAREELDFTLSNGLYTQVENLYGVDHEDIFMGFDSRSTSNEVQILACNLRHTLEDLGMMYE